MPAYFIRGLCLFIYIPYTLEQGKTGIKTLLLNFVCVYIPVDYFAKQDTSFLVFPRTRPKHRCRLSFLRQFLRWVPCARWWGRPRGRERVRFWGNPNSLLKVPGKNDFSHGSENSDKCVVTGKLHVVISTPDGKKANSWCYFAHSDGCPRAEVADRF